MPGDKDVEKEYIFEVHGEVKVMGYSEEDAEEELRRNFKELVNDSYANGDIDVQ